MGSVLLVRRLMGDTAVHSIPAGVLPGGGALCKIDGEWRVYIARDFPDSYKRFIVLHELAHWALGPSATEDDCDSLASALLDRIDMLKKVAAAKSSTPEGTNTALLGIAQRMQIAAKIASSAVKGAANA